MKRNLNLNNCLYQKKVLIIRKMAGVEGFEPSNAGIKSRCLNRLATPHYKLDVVARLLQRNNEIFLVHF